MAKKAALKAQSTEPQAEPSITLVPTAIPQTKPVVEAKSPVSEPKPHKVKAHRHTGTFIYFAGIITALLSAIMVPYGNTYYMYVLLALIGFVVGLMNITDDEVLLYLVATVAFVVSASSVKGVLVGAPVVQQFLNNVIIFTAAGAFVVSMKAIIKVAKTK